MKGLQSKEQGGFYLQDYHYHLLPAAAAAAAAVKGNSASDVVFPQVSWEDNHLRVKACSSSNMSTIGRTIKNVLKTGPKDALHQMNNIGDTKWGPLIGIDRFGNKYFENNDEISGQ